MFVRRASALVLAVSTLAAALGTTALAAPNQPDAAEAGRAIEENGLRTTALAEATNAAEFRLREAKATLERSRVQIAELRARLAEDRARLAREGAGIYRNASEGGLLPTLFTGHDATQRRRARYGAAAANATRRLVDQLVATEAALTAQEGTADSARRDAEQERDRLVRARDELAAADARQQQLLADAPAEVAASLSDPGTQAPPRTTGSTSTSPAAPAPTAPTTGAPAPAPASPAPTPAPAPAPAPGPAPAPSSGAAAAVAFARAQLGKPYVYAAAGPDAYDCSGLTMAAWRAGGVSLPHYSGAQYSRLRKVSMSALQPGDLIFWGPGGSDHVAIYIGGGKIISAPYTGTVVRIQSIWGAPIGAARP